MKKVVVYHDTETLAKRGRRGRPGETLTYRSIKDWDETDNDENFDEVVDLATKPAKKSKPSK